MRGSKCGSIVMVALALVGCYHATVETGLPAGNQTIENDWATSFIYGLVPPATVSTASQCRSGVARVETQHSFLNSLVGGLTFGIFTPMTIKVTCAAARAQIGSASQLAVRAEASPAVMQAVFAGAAAAAAAAPGGVAFVSFVPPVSPRQ
jgi:Bor protein